MCKMKKNVLRLKKRSRKENETKYDQLDLPSDPVVKVKETVTFTKPEKS